MRRATHARRETTRHRTVALAAALLAGLLLAPVAGSAGAACGTLLSSACATSAATTTTTTTTTEPPVIDHGHVSLVLDRPSVTIHKPLKRVQVSGQLTKVAAPGGLAVVLEARSAAYRRTRTLRGTTDAQGRFKFSLQPAANASLTARIVSGQPSAGESNPVQLVVFPRLTFNIEPATRVPLRVGFSLVEDGPRRITFDAGVSVRSKPGTAHWVYFYAAPRTGHTFTRVAQARLRSRGCSAFCVIGGEVRVAVTTRLHEARRFLACARGTVFGGLGIVDPTCGRTTVRR